MTADSRPPRVRIAPSPTGTPHVGTAYIALFNRALARRHGGQFILRIEDTDQERSNPVYEQHIIDALKWLGLDWDEGPDVGGPHAPYRQSERTELYQQHAQMLIDNGTAYRCFCTKERLDELREKQKEQQKAGEKVRLGYDKHCLSLSQKDIDKHLKDKVPFVVRLDIPDSGDTTFGDLLRGEIRHANAELDDKVLLKSDGFPTYHLANVVDDHAMEITHVIRAEEWISSTPLHRLLYKAFGWEPPVFCHMPLLRNQGGGKISKRKNPVSLDFYRALGVLPDAMINFLGLQGYSMPDGVLEGGSEFFAPQTFIDNFELKRVTTSGPVFDLDKLRAINGLHIQKLSPEAFRAAVHGHVDSWLDRIGSLAQPRMSLLGDWGSEHSFYYAWQMPITLAAFEPATKRLDAAKVGEALGVFAEALQNLQPHEWTAAVLDEKSSGIAETFEWTAKKDRTAFFQAIRIATTGRTMTPPLGDTLAAMERYTVVSRVLAAVAVLGAK